MTVSLIEQTRNTRTIERSRYHRNSLACRFEYKRRENKHTHARDECVYIYVENRPASQPASQPENSPVGRSDVSLVSPSDERPDD